MAKYKLKIKNDDGTERTYYDELLKTGESKDYINSEKYFENVEAFVHLCAIIKERFEAVYAKYDKTFCEEDFYDFLDASFDYCLNNFGDLKLKKSKEAQRRIMKLQLDIYAKSDIKDTALKLKLSKIGLMDSFAELLCKYGFKSNEVLAFKNLHNYDFPEEEDKGKYFEKYKKENYILIDFEEN